MNAINYSKAGIAQLAGGQAGQPSKDSQWPQGKKRRRTAGIGKRRPCTGVHASRMPEGFRPRWGHWSGVPDLARGPEFGDR